MEKRTEPLGQDPKLLYRAESAIEAAQYAQALESAGIRSQTAGGEASMSFGEIGGDALRVDLYVATMDLEAGMRVIEAWQSRESRGADGLPSAWACEACGEQSPGNFDCCWACGVGRT